jgi:hypothetical protein
MAILTVNDKRVYVRNKSGGYHDRFGYISKFVYTQNRAGVPDLFAFDVVAPGFNDDTKWIPKKRDEIKVYKTDADLTGGNIWFGGLITFKRDRNMFRENDFTPVYTIEAQSYDVLLEKQIRQEQVANLTWKQLIELILTNHYQGQLSQDFQYIVNGDSAPPVQVVNSTLGTLLKSMKQITQHDYYVDELKRLHVFKNEDNPASFTLTDTSPSPAVLKHTGPITVSNDSRQLVNVVRQPFIEEVTKDEWEGESFLAKGDPKGQRGGYFPLLRKPQTKEKESVLDDKFEGSIDAQKWLESDVVTTQHPDYLNQGYLFSAEGQLQIVGGPGTLGVVALQSQEFVSYVNGSYLVFEFQLTDITGSGFFGCFSDGVGISVINLKAGFKVVDNQLLSLDDTVLVSALNPDAQTFPNYVLWVTMTSDGWQYHIQGGEFATRKLIHTETGITHLSSYKVLLTTNEDAQASINSVQFRNNIRSILLKVNGEVKTVGFESLDAELPDIDAYLNVDESPALIKFKGSTGIGTIVSSIGQTSFTVSTGQGALFTVGDRLLIGRDIVEEFQGQVAFVQSVSGDTINLVGSGATNLVNGNLVLIGTTVPGYEEKVEVEYSYLQEDEAVASDPDSVDEHGSLPITLEKNDFISDFDTALRQAEAYLSRFTQGITRVSFKSNSVLIDEPSTLESLQVSLNKRDEPIDRTFTISKVTTRQNGKVFTYDVEAETADPVSPLETVFKNQRLIIGNDGVIRLTATLREREYTKDEVTTKKLTSQHITWDNPENRKWGEFKWKAS